LERPLISKILLAEPLEVVDGKAVPLIELIPPVHQRDYRMGLEHLGVVVGDPVDDFSRTQRAVLTGQQFQSETTEAPLRPVRGLHARQGLPTPRGTLSNA
jgi:hypothetical protein